MKKKEYQLNIKLTKEEFDIVKNLMQKHSVNISQFIKNNLLQQNKKLENDISL